MKVRKDFIVMSDDSGLEVDYLKWRTWSFLSKILQENMEMIEKIMNKLLNKFEVSKKRR